MIFSPALPLPEAEGSCPAQPEPGVGHPAPKGSLPPGPGAGSELLSAARLLREKPGAASAAVPELTINISLNGSRYLSGI